MPRRGRGLAIKSPTSFHLLQGTSTMTAAITSTAPARRDARDERVRAAVDAHYDALWRFLRRMGVAPRLVEDAAQQVFIVFAERMASVAPSSERSFLFGTALRVASDVRRKADRG